MDVGVVSGDIAGTVSDGDQPIFNASVRIFSGVREIEQVYTDETGGFYVELEEGEYIVQVYAASFLPALYEVDDPFSQTNITLSPATVIELSGDLQFVDTENLPLQTVITILDETGSPLTLSGFSLVYGTQVGGKEKISSIAPNMILVPSERSVVISLNNSYLIGSRVETRVVEIEFNSFSQSQIDLREYTIPLNLLITNESLLDLESRLVELKGYGFYLTRQETAYAIGNELVAQSQVLYGESEYGESYEALKRGFIASENTMRELNQMYRDAEVSIFILICFLAVSSLILGYLMTDDYIRQLVLDFGIYGVVLVFFYYTYPGSRIISTQRFLFISIVILIGFMVFGKVLPSFFRVGSGDGRVHTRNLFMPIFSLAKRSLRRRKLRFLLTLISLTLLVTSFVTLTSVSQGYGVVSGWSQPKTSWEGVFIRDSGWTQNEPSFLVHDSIEVSWLISQPEVSEIYSKSLNGPLQRPYSIVEGQPVFSVIGGDDNEYSLIGLESTLLIGRVPLDGVVVSETFTHETGLTLGDKIQLGPNSLPIEGVFSDSLMSRLQDLDGSSYLGEKWVNTNPGDEAPVWVLETVEPREQVFTTKEIANSLPLIGVQRTGITLNQGYPEDDFAERLSLERGYKAYSSTVDGFTSYRLGNYFEGKGLSLVIPWVIVVLNVVVTMLNSLFERRKEIEILSSIGLNPAQVSAVFVAEATITGFIAGGLGYLAGLGFYKALALLNIGLQVHQKVSAVWSIASIALAISAVLTGAFAALRNSVVITPSLMRRWKIDRSTGGFAEPWRVDVPVKLRQEEIAPYLDYVESRLVKLIDHPTQVTSSIRRSETRIEFIYKSNQATTGNFYTRNDLQVQQNGEEYLTFLNCVGDPDWVHVVGSLIRRITMDYTTDRN